MKPYNRKENYLEQQRALNEFIQILQENKAHYTAEHINNLKQINDDYLEAQKKGLEGKIR